MKKERYERYEKVLACATNPEYVKDHLVLYAMNTNANQRIVESCPSIQKNNLSLIVRLVIEESDESLALVCVDEALMKVMNFDKDELFKEATQSVRSQYVTMSMEEAAEILKENYGATSDLPEAKRRSLYPTFYTSIPRYGLDYFGAAAFFDERLLKELSRSLGSDLIIIPSSVHELLYVPVSAAFNTKDLLDLSYSTRDVNADLNVVDRLSDNAYRYFRATGETVIIGEERELDLS